MRAAARFEARAEAGGRTDPLITNSPFGLERTFSNKPLGSGYAALQSAVVDPDLFKAVVAIAPVTDLSMLKEEHRHWSDFATVSAYIGEGPHLHAGSPAEHADRFVAPVLLFHGAFDRNVSIDESRHMAGTTQTNN